MRVQNTVKRRRVITIWRIFTKHVLIILIMAVLLGGTSAAAAIFLIPARFEAGCLLFVEPSGTSVDGDRLAENSAVLFTVDEAFRELKRQTGYTGDASRLKPRVAVRVVGGSDVISLRVTAGSADDARYIAETYASICTERFGRLISGANIKIADAVTAGENPVFPNIYLFGAAGFALGLLLSFLICFIAEALDTKVKAEDDLFHIYDIPVFAEIMSFGKSKEERDAFFDANR